MPKVSYAKREAEELEEWLESRRIDSVRFPTTEPAVDIHFDNQLFLRLDFSGHGYSFTGDVQLRDRKNPISASIEVSRRDTDILLMAYNILESDETGGFIRVCGEHVEDLWSSDTYKGTDTT